MHKMKTPFSMLAGMAIAVSPTVSICYAAKVAVNSTAPNVDSLDIANITTATGIHHIWNDRPECGNTFMTGPNGGKIHSITVQLQDKDGEILQWTEYRIRLGTIKPSGNNNVFNKTHEETVKFGDNGSPASIPNNSWITFTLDQPQVLKPNTRYGFDIGIIKAEHDWKTGIQCLSVSGDNYDGGHHYAMNTGSGPSNKIVGHPGDILFHLDITTTDGTAPPIVSIPPATKPIEPKPPTSKPQPPKPKSKLKGETLIIWEDFERPNNVWGFEGNSELYNHEGRGDNFARTGSGAASLLDAKGTGAITLKQPMRLKSMGAGEILITFDYKWYDFGDARRSFSVEYSPDAGKTWKKPHAEFTSDNQTGSSFVTISSNITDEALIRFSRSVDTRKNYNAYIDNVSISVKP